MNKKKQSILFIQITGSIAGILLELFIFVKIADLIAQNQSIQNVFDEMMVNDARALRESANICNVIYDRPRTYYVTMEYKNIEGNISSMIWMYFYPDIEGINADSPLYIWFKICDKEGNILDCIHFYYYKKVNKLYIYSQYDMDEKGSITWEELEDYKDYLLYDIIIGSYLDNGKSRFSMENLGEFEVIDYLMPYEYCGMSGGETVRTEVDEHGVSYTTWLDTGNLFCIQQEIQHRNGRSYGSDSACPAMLTDEILGRDIGVSRFAVQIDGKECRLSDLIEINDDFIEWVKNSGQAQGNLERISPDRETGCIKTQQMLQNFPEEQMRTVLENCEFYIEPGYLHVRFPYWDYERKEPGFVMNGNDLWRGWLTMKTEDIEGFLKVEKW